MVAPIDAKVELKVDGETITLRLNFRSISLLEENGLDLFSESGVQMSLAKAAKMCRFLAVTDHPEMTDDEALAVVSRSKQAFGLQVIELIERFGGKPAEDAEGNGGAADQVAA